MWQGNPEALRQAQEQLTDASRELLTNANRLRDQGLSEEELKAVRELGEALRGGLQGNPELLDQEFQRLVNLTEQLELKLASTGSRMANAPRCAHRHRRRLRKAMRTRSRSISGSSRAPDSQGHNQFRSAPRRSRRSNDSLHLSPGTPRTIPAAFSFCE